MTIRFALILLGFLLIPFPVFGQDREPSLYFAPGHHIDILTFLRYKEAVDNSIVSNVDFTNATLSDIVAWLADNKPKDAHLMNIQFSAQINKEDMLLPPTPDRITIHMNNSSFRDVLNQICLKANLSWRFERTSLINNSPQLVLGRPELFMRKKVSDVFIEWFPLIIAAIVISLWLSKELILSLLCTNSLNAIGREVLGPKYAYLIHVKLTELGGGIIPPMSMHLVGFLGRRVLGPLPMIFNLFMTGRLKFLLQENRAQLVKEIYFRLMAKGDIVPKEAWDEFFKRNPEAKGLQLVKNKNNNHNISDEHRDA